MGCYDYILFFLDTVGLHNIFVIVNCIMSTGHYIDLYHKCVSSADVRVACQVLWWRVSERREEETPPRSSRQSVALRRARGLVRLSVCLSVYCTVRVLRACARSCLLDYTTSE